MNAVIPSISYKWDEHNCYVGTISYGEIPNVIVPELDLAMNRDIDKKRVKEIVEYISEEMNGAFFPPVILNCKATTDYNEKERKLIIIEGKLKIIDGQHRLNSIIELIDKLEGEQLKKLKKIKLPVLVIEGLEDYEHRSLFYKINKKSKNVDSNISLRFTPTIENLLGLKYVSKHLDKKNLIEWEKKQSFSKDKIAYIHLVDCLKKITKSLSTFNKEHPCILQ